MEARSEDKEDPEFSFLPPFYLAIIFWFVIPTWMGSEEEFRPISLIEEEN